MKLTQAQEKEVEAYVHAASTFHETYHEIYDHVLNAIEHVEEPFKLELVGKIVREDFGSFKEIKKMENKSLSTMKWTYFREIAMDMIKFSRLSDIAITTLLLVFASVFSFYHQLFFISLETAYVVFGAAGYAFMIIWLFGNRYFRLKWNFKFSLRRSLTGDLVMWLICVPYYALPSVYLFLFDRNISIDLSSTTKNSIVCGLFFFTIIYGRSFVKVYERKIRDLVVY